MEILFFDRNFNQPIKSGILPRSLKELIFSYCSEFNQPIEIGWISEGIEILTIGENFQFPLIPDIFPSSLKELNIHCKFIHQINRGIFPSSLENLFLNSALEEPIAVGIFPSNLKKLNFGENFNQPILQNSLPPGLESLLFENSNFYPLFPSILPESLKELIFRNFFFPIPPKFLPSKLNSKFHYFIDFDDSKFEPELDFVKFRKLFQIEEQLGIPCESKFRIVEKMKSNEGIYLIEIVRDQFENKELNNLSWNQLFACGDTLELIENNVSSK